MTHSEAREILGVPIGFTPADLKKSYRIKAAASHPDKPHGDAWYFRTVREAHDLLTGSSEETDTTPAGHHETSQESPQTPSRDLPPIVKDILETLADEGSTKGLERYLGDRAGPAQVALRSFLCVFAKPSKKRRKK